MTPSRNATPSASRGPAPSTIGWCATSTISPRVLHEAFYVAHAPAGPDRWWSTSRKDVQFADRHLSVRPRKSDAQHLSRRGSSATRTQIRKRRGADGAAAKRPVFYTGGGVINSGPEASKLLRELVEAHRLSDHLDADGARCLSRRPTSNWLGMLGMHGTYEANHGDARLRRHDRASARASTTASPAGVDAFSPGSKKIHIDIDPSSINKNIRVDVPIIGDARVTGDLLQVIKAGRQRSSDIGRGVVDSRSTAGGAQNRSPIERSPR